MLATLMAFQLSSFSHTIASANVAQARTLAQKLGYQAVVAESNGDGTTRLTVNRRRKVHLRLVSASDQAKVQFDEHTIASGQLEPRNNQLTAAGSCRSTAPLGVGAIL